MARVISASRAQMQAKLDAVSEVFIWGRNFQLVRNLELA